MKWVNHICSFLMLLYYITFFICRIMVSVFHVVTGGVFNKS